MPPELLIKEYKKYLKHDIDWFEFKILHDMLWYACMVVLLENNLDITIYTNEPKPEWQEICDFLDDNGFEVKVVEKETCTYSIKKVQ